MKRTFGIFTLVAILLALVAPAPAATHAPGHHCHQHICDSRCHGHDHWQHGRCDLDHCDGTCQHVIWATNTVVVVNTVIESHTNTVIETRLVSMPTADIAITDFEVQQNHVYRFYTAGQHYDCSRPPQLVWGSWKSAGAIRATSNHTARVVLPVAALRPTLWQLVDVTIGYPHAAVQPVPVTNEVAVTYIGMSGRLSRVPDRRP